MDNKLLPLEIVLKIGKDGIEYTKNGSIQKVLLPFNLEELRLEISKIDYYGFYKTIGGRYARTDEIENIKVSPFSFLYYFLLGQNGKVPSPKQLSDAYLKHYCVNVGSAEYSIKPKYTNNPELVFSENSMIGRICRAYNALNRELELLLQLFEHAPDDFEVYFNIQDDFYCGVDIALIHNKNFYGIVSYSYSTYSMRNKALMDRYAGIYNNVYIIPVPAIYSEDNTNLASYGDLKLYEHNTAEKIIDTILGKPTQYNMELLEDYVLCPTCGSIMKKRVAGKGPNVGREFLGCSKYPKCTQIINL